MTPSTFAMKVYRNCRTRKSSNKAFSEGPVILTFDLDFGEITALSYGRIVSVVLFRLHNTRTPHVIDRLDVALQFRQDLEKGAVVLVEETRCRVRRLPIGPPNRP
jgi:predicted nuclease of predicted toxin-antitoxin system